VVWEGNREQRETVGEKINNLRGLGLNNLNKRNFTAGIWNVLSSKHK